MLGQLGDDLLGGIVLERAAEGLAALFPQQQHHEVEHLASPGFGDSDVGELGHSEHPPPVRGDVREGVAEIGRAHV